MKTLIIGNINHTNEVQVVNIAGGAGYAGSVWLVDEETKKIDLQIDSLYEQREVEQMIGKYVLAGFSVKIIES
jgi:hypothetical protein